MWEGKHRSYFILFINRAPSFFVNLLSQAFLLSLGSPRLPRVKSNGLFLSSPYAPCPQFLTPPRDTFLLWLPDDSHPGFPSVSPIIYSPSPLLPLLLSDTLMMVCPGLRLNTISLL